MLVPRKSSILVPFAESTASRIAPPPDLKGPAREAFLDIVLACRADFFEASDRG
ncbi:hypothetical protein ABIF86_005628 [Bradyrhizobium japonicum]